VKRLICLASLVAFTFGCGETTPTKKNAGSGASTPSTTQGAPIPKDSKPKMD
jgi:hypothetical protein